MYSWWNAWYYWLKNKVVKPEPLGLIIDVSYHNGPIDWQLVKHDPQKIKGAILRASEGSTVRDKRIWENIAGCVKNGLKWGAYHFATFNNEDEKADATAEALFFLSIIKAVKERPTLPLVLDIESNKPIPYTHKEMIDYVSTFRKVVEDAGYELAIYSSPGFLQQYLPENHPFTDMKLIAADYTGDINHVPGWKKVFLRQYTDEGRVWGISTAVDMNEEPN